MSIDLIKEDIFNLISIEKEAMYSESKDEKKKHIIKHSILKDYYLKLVTNNSFSYVLELKEQLLKKSSSLEDEYKKLVEQYQNEKNIKLKNDLVSKINELASEIDAYNRLYNIIVERTKIKNSDNLEYSNSIIKTLIRLNSEKNPEIKEKINSEAYSLIDARRARLVSCTDNNILKEITELESIEYRIADMQQIVKSYSINRNELASTLRNIITAINDYNYLGVKKSKYYKYNNKLSKEENDSMFFNSYKSFVNDYYSIISSIFKNNFYIINLDNKRVSTDDLISYLYIYNLDGNYELFKRKYKNNEVGNDKVNESDYSSSLDMIRKSINTLLKDIEDKVKGKKIEITDSRSDIEALINTRNNKISEIDSIIGGIEVKNARN